MIEFSDKRKTFEIESEYLDPSLPVKIIFKPVGPKALDYVTAYSVNVRGEQLRATPNEISLVTGKEFYTNDNRRIARKELILWLNGCISTWEAMDGIRQTKINELWQEKLETPTSRPARSQAGASTLLRESEVSLLLP